MEAAKQEVARREGDSSSGNDDSSYDEEEEGSGEEEMGMKNEPRTRNASKRDMVPGRTKTLQLAALDFCNELLNQVIVSSPSLIN